MKNKTYAYLVVTEEIATGKKYIKIWSNHPQNTGLPVNPIRINTILMQVCYETEDFGRKFQEAHDKLLDSLLELSKFSAFFYEVRKYLERSDCLDCSFQRNNGPKCQSHGRYKIADSTFKKYMKLK